MVVQEELGGAGVYSMDERLLWADIPEDQRHDIMPEIWDGHNIADFVDPDIDAKLRALEREEDAAAALAEAAVRPPPLPPAPSPAHDPAPVLSRGHGCCTKMCRFR